MSYNTPPPTPRRPVALEDEKPGGGAASGGAAGTPASPEPPPPPSPPSPKSSLRGAASPRGSEKEQPEVIQQITKAFHLEKEKLELGSLPTTGAAYQGWRDNVEVQITCSGYDGDLIEPYLDECNTMEKLEDISNIGLPAEMKALDRKLYKVLFACCKGEERLELMNKAKVQAQKANGRQLLRVIDKHFNYEASKIGSRASRKITNKEVKDMVGLGPFIAEFRKLNQDLDATKMPMHPTFGLELLKSATKNLKDSHFASELSNFEHRPETEKTMYNLLDGIERVANT